MRIPHTLLITAAILAPLPALAEEDPAPSPFDGRIRSVAYNPQQVIRLEGTVGMPLRLIFESGEKPTQIAGVHVFQDPSKVGNDEPGWWFVKPSGTQAQPGNALLLTPVKAVYVPVLLINTKTADGEDRYYTLELRARPANAAIDSSFYVSVQFTYKAAPDPDAIEAAKARRAAQQEARQEQIVSQRLYAAAHSGPVNGAYRMRGDVGCPVLGPVRTSDNGVTTSFVFTPNATVPEIYVINEDGKKTVTTPISATSPIGLQFDIPGIHRDFYLRRGDKGCVVHNFAYDPVGIQPGGGTGTISPYVMRTVRQ